MKLTETDDRTLVKQSQLGDKEAFRQLMERYQDRVFNSVYRIIGDADEADNLLQETFFKAYKALDQFKQESQFSTWLYRIAMNNCASYLRKLKTVKHQKLLSLDTAWGGGEDSGKLQMADKTITPYEELVGSERQMVIQNAITELEPDLRRIVVLKDVENYSYEEIAEIIGCPMGTVKSRLFKAREQLRERLKRLLP
ncbi:sigma-70 family RNA polymerase sigma factor [Planctomycetota bacterium]